MLPPASRIYLVDEHPIVARGLAQLVGRQPGWEVCGTACDLSKALGELLELKPNLLITGVNLKGQSGLDLVRRAIARLPKMAALVFSMHDESLYAPRALAAGATGYVMKQESLTTLLRAIQQVLTGEVFLSDRLQRHPLHEVQKADSLLNLAELTDRELHVFRLLGQGFTTQEIARLLDLSIKTIGAHRVNMMVKLGMTGASQLVQYAIASNREHNPTPLEAVPLVSPPANPGEEPAQFPSNQTQEVLAHSGISPIGF